jgi:hypothetical protein
VRIVLITICLVIIIAASYINNSGRFSNFKKQSNQEPVNSQEKVLSQESKTETDSNVNEVKEIKEEPSKKIEPTNTPSPTSVPSSTNLSDFIYPGSEVLSSSDSSLSLKSSADTDTIASWYKDKLKESGTSLSFAKADANGKISISISGYKNSIKFEVDVKKEADDAFAYITVKS